MKKWEHSAADVDAQISRLRLPEEFKTRRGRGLIPPSPPRPLEDDYYVESGWVRSPVSEPLFGATASADSSGEELPASTPAEEELGLLPPQSDDDAAPDPLCSGDAQANYILSYTLRRRRVTAHKVVGGCYRRPRIELKDYEFVSAIIQGDGLHLCRDCWKESKGNKTSVAEDLGSDEGDSSGGSLDSSSSNDH